jgi:hypothetical protein
LSAREDTQVVVVPGWDTQPPLHQVGAVRLLQPPQKLVHVRSLISLARSLDLKISDLTFIALRPGCSYRLASTRRSPLSSDISEMASSRRALRYTLADARHAPLLMRDASRTIR